MKNFILSLTLLLQITSTSAAPVDFLRCKESVKNSMLERSLKYNNIVEDFSSLINNFTSNNYIYLEYSQVLMEDASFVGDAYTQIYTMFQFYENDKINITRNRDSTMSFVSVNFERIKRKNIRIGNDLEKIRYRPLFREAMQLKTEIDRDLDNFRYCYK
jgi:hypothetical protein